MITGLKGSGHGKSKQPGHPALLNAIQKQWVKETGPL